VNRRRLTEFSEIESLYTISDNGGFEELADIDYDLQYNLPVTLNGTCTLNVGICSIGIAAEAADAYLTFELFRVDNENAEYSLGSVQSETFSKTGATTTYHVTHLQIDLDHYHLAEQEKLRLNVKVFGSGSGTGAVGRVFVGGRGGGACG